MTDLSEEYLQALEKLIVNKIPHRFDQLSNECLNLFRKMSQRELNECIIITLQHWLPTLEDILYSFLDEIFNCGADPNSILTFSGELPIGGDEEDEREDIRLIKFFIRRGASVRTLKHLIGLMLKLGREVSLPKIDF